MEITKIYIEVRIDAAEEIVARRHLAENGIPETVGTWRQLTGTPGGRLYFSADDLVTVKQLLAKR